MFAGLWHRARLGIAALVAAIGFLAAVGVAQASLQVTVGNPGLAHFDAEGAVQLHFGLTDQNGQPVGNLTQDNVKVFEDGKPARIVDFRGVGQGRPVDIVFVIDITESMQPYIDAVKQNMVDFAHDLAANNRDYRLGLVTFEDYVVSAYPDCDCEYRNALTSDVNKFIGWVGTLHAGGGGDIPEDQLDGLAYAATMPLRPDAQGIVILITDAPPHVAGDGTDPSGDSAYRLHHPFHDSSGKCWYGYPNEEPAPSGCSESADETEQTGATVANAFEKDGLTLYAVAPPPFIAPQYDQIVEATHGRLYNIVSEASRFPELVREIGHSIATEYTLSYLTPRPIEDGTNRSVELQVNYGGDSGTATTSYQVRGVGGAAINEPPVGGSSGESVIPIQVSFRWWNGAVPLIAILALLGLSRLHFGVSREELNAMVEAQGHAPRPGARQVIGQQAPPQASGAQASTPPSPVHPQSALTSPRGGEPRLTVIEPIAPVAAQYALLKEEVSLGRGEDNDIVIPHTSVSRTHARLLRRDGSFVLTDLNSTNGSYVNNQRVHGSVVVSNGSELRLGDIRFVLHF
jgi:hypothetical protein